jgi:hypothetical protein
VINVAVQTRARLHFLRGYLPNLIFLPSTSTITRSQIQQSPYYLAYYCYTYFAIALSFIMAQIPLAENPPHSTLLLATPERLEAARICCLVFEEKAVPDLGRGHERADRKLTSSELLRITSSFFLAWRILLDTQSDDLPTVQEHVEGFSPRDVLYVHELARFVASMFEISQHREIGRLMGYTAGGDVHDKWMEIVRTTWDYFQLKGFSFLRPAYGPLGMGLLFDDWQKEYVDEQMEQYKDAMARMAARSLSS